MTRAPGPIGIPTSTRCSAICDGETEECASLAVHQDTQEDGTEVFTYLVDDAEVDQDTFAAEFEELVGSRLLSLEDWTPATERPG